MSSFKAFERRNKTLLVEYKNLFKANKFNDKRIGENDTNLSLEDKIFKRFVAERQKSNRDRKASRYNLNDDEEEEVRPSEDLTHMGQSLAQIERFERIEASDDEEDEEQGRLNAKMVSENFFGGFDDNADSAQAQQENKKKSRKEWIDEMIAKSKQLKYERQKEKDKTLELTDKLDKEWRNLIPIINPSLKKNQTAEEEDNVKQKPKPDDYDVLVRSLQFESIKAQPTDKMKTLEEIEKERLDAEKKHEMELKRRMNEEIENDDEEEKKSEKKLWKKSRVKIIEKPNHFSVDDMDFNEPEYLQLQVRDEIKEKNKRMEAEEKEAIRKEKSMQEDEEEREEEYENDEEEEGEGEGEEEEEEESEEDETLSHSEQESAEDTLSNEKWIKKFEQFCAKYKQNSIDANKFEQNVRSMIEKELDPSRDEHNKDRLAKLNSLLIDHFLSLFHMDEKKKQVKSIDLTMLKVMTELIHHLTFKYGNKSTKKEPSKFVEPFKKYLINLNNQYSGLKLGERNMPSLDTLFAFKLISNIFPTSDFRHQITTPTLLLMTRYLTQGSIQTVSELFRGILLCTLCYEFIRKSKRFIPECIQFLNGILYLSIDKQTSNKKAFGDYDSSTVYVSFKRTNLNLFANKKVNKLEPLSLTKMCVNESREASHTLAASITAYTLDLLTELAQIYDELVSFKEIFALTYTFLGLLPSENYPQELQKKIANLRKLIEETSDKPREYLQCLNKKPVANKLFEPRVEAKSKFDPRHHNAVISEKQLMTRKYKKELKSAIKEVRQDNKFIARVRLNEQLEKDAKRSKKVKEIMGSLATQEGEYKKAKRLKS